MTAHIKTLLVVEDDAQMQFGISKRLTRAGFHVLTASSGTDALRIAKLYELDAVTLDIRLSDIDGLEVASELRAQANTSKIPIVFVAGKVDRDVEEACATLGNSYFIRKPYDSHLLVQLLKGLVYWEWNRGPTSQEAA